MTNETPDNASLPSTPPTDQQAEQQLDLPHYDYEFSVWPHEGTDIPGGVFALCRHLPSKIKLTSVTEAGFRAIEHDCAKFGLAFRDIERKPVTYALPVTGHGYAELYKANLQVLPPHPLMPEDEAELQKSVQQIQQNRRWQTIPISRTSKVTYDFWSGGPPPKGRDAQIARLHRYKELAVARQDFEAASAARDEADRIKKDGPLPSDVDYRYASGMSVCAKCKRQYFDHPAGGPKGIDDKQFLTQLCDGSLVKL